MGWTEDIFRAFFVTFGAAEIISNLYHLSKRDLGQIANYSRKQHSEIPLESGDRHFVVKAVLMLIFGFTFLVAGVVMSIKKTLYYNVSMIIMIVLALYGIIQGVVDRKCWRSLMAIFIYSLTLIIYIYIGYTWR